MPVDPQIYIHHFNGDILGGTNELMVCLAQTPPPNKEEIRNGNASPLLTPFLTSFLVGNPAEGINSRLNEMIPETTSFLLVMIPEFAISIANWSSLDSMIRQLQRPVIVIGGVGVVASPDLRLWKNQQSDEAGTTQRIFGFSTGPESGAATVRYNVGCCWIHQPMHGTQCVLFLKNYLERASEAINIPGLTEGHQLLCIKANDLCIYPLICAEFTSQQAASKPLTRIKSHLETESGNVKILIAGVAYESNTSHPRWGRGIKESVQIQPDGKIITVLVNNAIDRSDPEEDKDKWRCLSGVFTLRRDGKEQLAQAPSRSIVGDDLLIGVVCRTGNPQVISGKISWDLRSSGSRFLWRASHRAVADAQGGLCEVDTGDLHNDELCRAIRRFSPPAGSSKNNNQRAALEEVKNHVICCDQPDAKILFKSLLLGLKLTAESELNPDRLFEIREHLMSGLFVVGAIKQKPFCAWQNDITKPGQLIDEGMKVHILVWSDPKLTRLAISRVVEEWARDLTYNKPLLVVADGKGGDFEREGLISATRRGDITSSGVSDITTPREICSKAYILRMGKIENCMETESYIAAINELLEQSMRELVQ